MAAVTISPKYQVVISKDVREQLGLSPGQKVEIFVYGGRIELTPVRPIETMGGFLGGMETIVERDEDRV